MRPTAIIGVTFGVLLASGAAQATLLWDGDASKGTAVFGDLQPINGTITIVDDPVYGKVFKIVCDDNGNTKARSEVSHMKGITLSNSGDYYIAWRSKWGPLPTKAGKWQVVSQIHLEGAGAVGGPVPFGLSVPGDGMMHFNKQDPSGTSSSMWDHSLPLDSWHKYVVHTKMSETEAGGSCEIWFDGVKQTLTNGQTNIPCAMAHVNSTSYWKWGVYRSGIGGPIGESVHYLQRPMLGTTYADVADDGGPIDVDAGPGADDGGTVAIADAGAIADAAMMGNGNGGSGGNGGGGNGGAGGHGGGGAPAPPGNGGNGVGNGHAGGCEMTGADMPAPACGLVLLACVTLALRRRARAMRARWPMPKTES